MGRNKYYSYLLDEGINDMLYNVPQLSYSKKLKLLKELRSAYTAEQINLAFNTYDLEYIKLNRVDLNRIKNTLKFYCQRHRVEGEINVEEGY